MADDFNGQKSDQGYQDYPSGEFDNPDGKQTDNPLAGAANSILSPAEQFEEKKKSELDYAEKNAAKKGKMGFVAENAYWVAPIVGASLPLIGRALGLGGKKNMKRNTMIGFRAGIDPGKQAMDTYLAENQKEAISVAQEVLNNQQIPDAMKTDPSFLISYVNKRMGDKAFDKSAFMNQIKQQIGSYYNTDAKTYEDMVSKRRNFNDIEVDAFAKGDFIPETHPNGSHLTLDFQTYNSTAVMDRINKALEAKGLKPLNQNNFGVGGNGRGVGFRMLDPTTRGIAIEEMKKLRFSDNLINNTLPDDSARITKDEEMKARIERYRKMGKSDALKLRIDQWIYKVSGEVGYDYTTMRDVYERTGQLPKDFAQRFLGNDIVRKQEFELYLRNNTEAVKALSEIGLTSADFMDETGKLDYASYQRNRLELAGDLSDLGRRKLAKFDAAWGLLSAGDEALKKAQRLALNYSASQPNDKSKEDNESNFGPKFKEAINVGAFVKTKDGYYSESLGRVLTEDEFKEYSKK